METGSIFFNNSRGFIRLSVALDDASLVVAFINCSRQFILKPVNQQCCMIIVVVIIEKRIHFDVTLETISQGINII